MRLILLLIRIKSKGIRVIPYIVKQHNKAEDADCWSILSSCVQRPIQRPMYRIYIYPPIQGCWNTCHYSLHHLLWWFPVRLYLDLVAECCYIVSLYFPALNRLIQITLKWGRITQMSELPQFSYVLPAQAFKPRLVLALNSTSCRLASR